MNRGGGGQLSGQLFGTQTAQHYKTTSRILELNRCDSLLFNVEHVGIAQHGGPRALVGSHSLLPGVCFKSQRILLEGGYASQQDLEVPQDVLASRRWMTPSQHFDAHGGLWFFVCFLSTLGYSHEKFRAAAANSRNFSSYSNEFQKDSQPFSAYSGSSVLSACLSLSLLRPDHNIVSTVS